MLFGCIAKTDSSNYPVVELGKILLLTFEWSKFVQMWSLAQNLGRKTWKKQVIDGKGIFQRKRKCAFFQHRSYRTDLQALCNIKGLTQAGEVGCCPIQILLNYQEDGAFVWAHERPPETYTPSMSGWVVIHEPLNVLDLDLYLYHRHISLYKSKAQEQKPWPLFRPRTSVVMYGT